MNSCGNDANDPLGAHSVHVAGEISITRMQDVPPRMPRRKYDSPPTIALRRGFSFDTAPTLPKRKLMLDELGRKEKEQPLTPSKALSVDSGLSLTKCLRTKYLVDAD